MTIASVPTRRPHLVLLACLGLAACSGDGEDPVATSGEYTLPPVKAVDFEDHQGVIRDGFTHIPRDAPVPPDAREKIKRYLQACIEPPLDKTSDIHDRWFQNKERMQAELEVAGVDIGNAALHAFSGEATQDYRTRRGLLMIGARAAPDSAKDLLYELTTTYGYKRDDRAEACMLLAEVDPRRFQEWARERLTERDRKTETRPDDEFLIRGWLTSCTVLDESPVDICVDVATNMWREQYSRYIAVEALAEYTDDPVVRQALETCLIESSGDGMLRIKAAQSIKSGYPRETSREIFEEVIRREQSINFRKFLVDLLATFDE